MTNEPPDGGPLIEVAAIRDIFVSGLGKVECAGGDCLRLVLYAIEQHERVVVAKIVMPAGAVPDIITHASCAIERRRTPSRDLH